MLKFPEKTLSFIAKHQARLIKRYLLRQKQEVDKNLKEVTEDDPVISPSLAESSEPGTDSYMADTHTKTLILESQLKAARSSIKTALLKIKKGTYGKCEKCLKHIEVGRLLAMPTAQYCISCSQKASKKA